MYIFEPYALFLAYYYFFCIINVSNLECDYVVC